MQNCSKLTLQSHIKKNETCIRWYETHIRFLYGVVAQVLEWVIYLSDGWWIIPQLLQSVCPGILEQDAESSSICV